MAHIFHWTIYVLFGIFHSGCCYSYFANKIPNGQKVPHPCKNEYWYGVGHENVGGGGKRNLFGLAFARNGYTWTKALCEEDSDYDTYSNGRELGDPECKWKEGDPDPPSNEISHPGVCEPWNHAGCISVNTFLQCGDTTFGCDALNDPAVKNFSVYMNDVPVPAKVTTYMCQVFDVPDVTMDYHIVANTPYIHNIDVMHHMMLYGCDTFAFCSGHTADNVTEAMYHPYECTMDPGGTCKDIIGMWSFGYKGTCEKPHLGFRIGKTGYRQVAIEVHWNNPQMKSNYRDSSGMTVYYTPKLRQYDAGVLKVGQESLLIPPGKESVVLTGSCASECSSVQIHGKINITAGFNHMHYLGKSERIESYRNGKLVSEITNEPIYSYDSPSLTVFEREIEVYPGDEIRATCEFRSTNKNTTTVHGEGTNDEMCEGYLTYYPKQNMTWSRCMSYGTIPYCKVMGPYINQFPKVNGCDWKAFTNTAGQQRLYEMITTNCKPFQCVSECITTVQELRKDPCMQGEIARLVEYVLFEASTDLNWVKVRIALHSCDAEIQNLEMTTQAPCPTEKSVSAAGRVLSSLSIISLMLISFM